MTGRLVPAAEYVRMSTEDQRYSIANQRAAIAEYAQMNQYKIVETFSDPGLSGVDLKHRPGLKALLNAAISGTAAFETILVLDVSRWGRFQDIDESAYYEFLCRRAGVRVQYCAEPFQNDYSAFSNLVKAIKRTMAAEFSRELGVKVHRAQLRLAQLGYKQGGAARIGLRRLLINHDGKPKQLLHPGQRKNVMSDRVLLVPGPESEVGFVRSLFKQVSEGRSIAKIALELRRRKRFGKFWHHAVLVNLLRNPQYMGTYVFNRSSTRLSAKVIANPPEPWVTAPEALSPIISPEIFAQVQERIANFTCKLSNDELLLRLKRLWQEQGSLSRTIIEKSPITPCPSTYSQRFGHLLAVLSQDKTIVREYVICRKLNKNLAKRFEINLPTLARISLARFNSPADFFSTLNSIGYVGQRTVGEDVQDRLDALVSATRAK